MLPNLPQEPHMSIVPNESHISPRLAWTLRCQREVLLPCLGDAGARGRLREYWRVTRRMEQVLDRVELHGKSRVVDVGGGLVTPLGWMPGLRTLVDPLASHYGQVVTYPPDFEICTGDGECLPFGNGVVDLVICTNCIDHTEDPHRIVGEIRRILRPGGWLWFTCELRDPTEGRNAGHPSAFVQVSLDSLLSEFEIELSWLEPWRGAWRFLSGCPAHRNFEAGYLLKR